MTMKYPIGIDSFEKVIEGGFYYVDKTLLAEEFLETNAKVQLITRPRRFGKTLNMSMLHHFFGDPASAELFRDLAISKTESWCHQGQYPVIYLNFKELNASDYATFLKQFADMMALQFKDRQYLIEGLDEFETPIYHSIVQRQCSETRLTGSLFLLMRYLQKHHGKDVILLIDEYDSPIHCVHAEDCYNNLSMFMCCLLGQALKGNESLEKAVLTGILRACEYDLNHLSVYTLLDHTFSNKFGFTEDEVQQMLDQAGLAQETEAVREWYNGYLIGETVIYNPWSMLNYIDKPDKGLCPYWVNTSSKDLVRDQLLGAAPVIQAALEQLLSKETIETRILEHTVFRDLKKDQTALWSLLLFNGYLKVVSKTRMTNRFLYQLAIPNEEVRFLYRDIIMGWTDARVAST